MTDFKNRKVTIRLTKIEYQKLIEYCKLNKISMSDFIRQRIALETLQNLSTDEMMQIYLSEEKVPLKRLKTAKKGKK